MGAFRLRRFRLGKRPRPPQITLGLRYIRKRQRHLLWQRPSTKDSIEYTGSGICHTGECSQRIDMRQAAGSKPKHLVMQQHGPGNKDDLISFNVKDI